MTPDAIYACAETLFTAEQTSRQCCLISVAHPKATLDDAYAIQSALVAKKLAAGRKVSGWKIGLTSRAMQSALGITTPDSGVLLDDMHCPNGPTVPPSRFIQPRVEAEIAFVMHASLRGAQVTRADVVAATDDVSASLEIQDTRILRADPATGQTRSIIDTVADNAADAGIVLGTAHHAIDAFDLRWVGVIVSRNGVVEETGLGAGMLNDPVTGILGLVHPWPPMVRASRPGKWFWPAVSSGRSRPLLAATSTPTMGLSDRSRSLSPRCRLRPLPTKQQTAAKPRRKRPNR